MKVNIVAVEFGFGCGIALKDLHSHLKSRNGDEIPFKGHDRILFVDEKDEYYTGLFISVKQNKKFCQMKKDADSITIKVSEIEKGNHLLDFNLFVINKKTSRGFYYYYHQSCSVNQFCYFLRDRFDELKKRNIEGLVNLGVSAEDAQAAYKGRLVWDPLLKEEAFYEAIKELDRIKSLKFSLRTLKPKQSKNNPTPQLPLVKAEAHSYSYFAGNAKDKIIGDVHDKLESLKPKRGRVIGMEGDVERIVSIINVPDSFGEYDFDAVAVHMDFEAEEFNSSVLIDELIKVAKDNQAMSEFELE